MNNEVYRAFMAKKRLFFLLAALVGAGMMWASCPEGFTDKVDATQYLTDIKLNAETGELTFTDNFMADQKLLRDYDIVFFRPNGTCPFYYNSMYDRYRFGMYNEYFLFNASIAYNVNSSAGGKKTFNIEEQLDKVLSYGYAKTYMALRPVYYTNDPASKKLISTSYYSNEDPKDDKGLWLVNGCYVTIPTISNISITLPDNAHFEQSMTVRVDLTSRNRCSCTLCYSEDGKKWYFYEQSITDEDYVTGIETPEVAEAGIQSENTEFRILSGALHSGQQVRFDLAGVNPSDVVAHLVGISGVVVEEQPMSSESTIQLPANLRRGMYLLALRYNGKVSTFKVYVE